MKTNPPSGKTGPLEVTSLSAIEHILLHRPDRIRKISVRTENDNPRIAAILAKAKEHDIRVERVKLRGPGEAISAELAPFAFVDLRQFLEAVSTRKTGLVIALDHLQDPHNFGAICRTADAFGCLGILLPKDRSVSVGPGVYSASVGAVDTVPIVLVNNLSDALRKLKEKGFWIVGTGIGKASKSLEETPSFEKVTLVLGRELEGMSANIEKTCDWITEIPLLGKVQSLNVSVAGGILIYEWTNRISKHLE